MPIRHRTMVVENPRPRDESQRSPVKAARRDVMGGRSLTIEKGVEMRADQLSHALPDGQSVPPRFENSPEPLACGRPA